MNSIIITDTQERELKKFSGYWHIKFPKAVPGRKHNPNISIDSRLISIDSRVEYDDTVVGTTFSDLLPTARESPEAIYGMLGTTRSY